SRQEATSGSLPFENAVASRAQRASWNEWRSSSGGAARLAAARTVPRSLISARRASAARAIGSRSAAAAPAPRGPPAAAGGGAADGGGGGAGGERALERGLGRGGVVEVEDQNCCLAPDPERLEPAP